MWALAPPQGSAVQGPNVVGDTEEGFWPVDSQWVMDAHKPFALPAMSCHHVCAGAAGMSEEGRPATTGLGGDEGNGGSSPNRSASASVPLIQPPGG